MNSVGVLMRRLCVVSVSGSVRARGRAGDLHIAAQLHVIAVGAHLAAVGLEVPDLGRWTAPGRSRGQLALRARVIVHLQLFEIDDAALDLLANHLGVEPIALAAVVAGLDDLRVARRVAGIRHFRGGRFRIVAAAADRGR